MTTQARKQALLEQIAICEGIVDSLKAEKPPPVALLKAVRIVLASYEEKLAAVRRAEVVVDAATND
jgi:hypothetical protein